MEISKTLYFFGSSDPKSPKTQIEQSSFDVSGDESCGLSVPIEFDLEGKRLAMERIRIQPFVSDTMGEPLYMPVQTWIEECGRQVTLPINFCGGIFIIRIYRLLTPPSEQTPVLMAGVYAAAAAYDFAFLALGHADDEADMTISRDGKPTRFVVFPNTRVVDGINLLLAGETAMQMVLQEWPISIADSGGEANGRHPLTAKIMEELVRALREASFPILLDLAGIGHSPVDTTVSSRLESILIDAESLKRIEAFTRYRAHTYFVRAFDLATLIAGFTDVEPKLRKVIGELFQLWGSLGAATDDLQDIFLDFATGIHSVCSVMAHLCVAEEAEFRPHCRQYVPDTLLRDQRCRLKKYFGVTDSEIDHAELIKFLKEIELDIALEKHLENQATLFAAKLGEAVLLFGFSAEILMEMAMVVSRDPEFFVPKTYLNSFKETRGERARNAMNIRAGRFIARNIIERFWPDYPANSV